MDSLHTLYNRFDTQNDLIQLTNAIESKSNLKTRNESLQWTDMIINRRGNDKYTCKKNNPHKTP
jgi:hypothetical protein